METVPFLTVLEEAAHLDGGRELRTDDLTAMGRVVNRWIRKGWQWYFWPELMAIEERHFRAEWTAQAYSAGAEVWHTDTAKYWEASEDALSTDEPGDSAKWTELTEFVTSIDREQSGKNPIGTVRRICADDPRLVERPRELRWERQGDAFVVFGDNVPMTVWVEYRRPVPEWVTTAYDGTETYFAGDVRFWTTTGDCYVAIDSNFSDQAPNQVAYWERLEFPARLRPYVAHGLYADVLRGDGQNSKSLAESGYALEWLYQEIDEIEGASGRVRRARWRR